MPVTQLGNDTTTVLADGTDFVMERVFDAPSRARLEGHHRA